MIRMTELLKSGIDFSNTKMKRSFSLYENNNDFFASMQKHNLEQGGRVRINSYAMTYSYKNETLPQGSSRRGSPSNAKDTDYDAPFSPEKIFVEQTGSI